MKTILILMLIGIIIGLIRELIGGYYSDFTDFFMASLTGGLIGFISGIIIALALPMDTYIKRYSINIESLKDHSNASGEFFLGCGSINGSMKYSFYYEENGLYRLMQLDYTDVAIKYSDKKPRVNVSELWFTDAAINQYAIDLNIGDKSYIIEVPEGTIKNNYILDSE